MAVRLEHADVAEPSENHAKEAHEHHDHNEGVRQQPAFPELQPEGRPDDRRLAQDMRRKSSRRNTQVRRNALVLTIYSTRYKFYVI